MSFFACIFQIIPFGVSKNNIRGVLLNMNTLDRFFWNQYAKSYDNLLRYYRPYQDLMHEVCSHVDNYAKGRPLRILDVGCGTGNYSVELSRRGHKVVGIDFSPSMLKRAQQKKDGGSGWPQFLFNDLNNVLPFKDDGFDAVICINVLYTIPDHEKFIEELRRIARSPSLLVMVNSKKPLSLETAIKHQWNVTNGMQLLYTLYSLATVGVWNIIISCKQRTGAYRPTSLEEMKKLLLSNGIWPLWIFETYVDGVLGMGWWR